MYFTFFSLLACGCLFAISMMSTAFEGVTSSLPKRSMQISNWVKFIMRIHIIKKHWVRLPRPGKHNFIVDNFSHSFTSSPVFPLHLHPSSPFCSSSEGGHFAKRDIEDASLLHKYLGPKTLCSPSSSGKNTLKWPNSSHQLSPNQYIQPSF